MIYKLMNDLKFAAILNPLVNMSNYGDIYVNYSDNMNNRYPFVNFDVVNCVVSNYVKIYTIRMYVADRQKTDVYTAYNKTEFIADTLLKDMEIDNYTAEYFKYDFLDEVHGVMIDFNYETSIASTCNNTTVDENNNILLESGDYVLQENGSLISVEQ